jgi:hypothetical protein
MRGLTIASAMLLSACAVAPATAPQSVASAAQECALSAADQAWVDASMDAWNDTAHRITGVGNVEKIRAVFFDTQCMVTSDTAMNGGPKRWRATRHDGQVQVPNGPVIPAGVISFAMGGEDAEQFVMSTPSVWRAANKSDNGLGSLETLMTVVVIHEGTHVAQIPTYGERIGALSKAHNLPEDFNDDSIQKRFEGNAEYAASMKRETELLFAAADAKDDAEARRLAREARALMAARHQRWFTGADSYLAAAEDVWLTMEGSAQWAAYRWVVDPRGGAVPPARTQFRTGRWWSQVQGFALFALLDRLVGESWKRHAFGDGAKTGVQMLDEALAQPA